MLGQIHGSRLPYLIHFTGCFCLIIDRGYQYEGHAYKNLDPPDASQAVDLEVTVLFFLGLLSSNLVNIII